MSLQLPIPATVAIAGCQFYAMRAWLAELVRADNLSTVSSVHFALGGAALSFSLLITAPYGRHSKVEKWNPLTWLPGNARWAWITQEIPTLLSVAPIVAAALASGAFAASPIRYLPAVLFLTHYTHRTLIFPFMIRTSNPVPLSVTALACAYCCFNGAIQAVVTRNTVASTLPVNFPLLGLGLVTFFAGMYINMSSDYHLIGLRSKPKPKTEEKKSEDSSPKNRYVIPRGGLFDFVSCPNFFGEVIEWFGYGLAVAGAVGGASAAEALQSTPFVGAVSFCAFTIANLLPRALSHHKYYLGLFGEEYKALGRKAMFPFLL